MPVAVADIAALCGAPTENLHELDFRLSKDRHDAAVSGDGGVEHRLQPHRRTGIAELGNAAVRLAGRQRHQTDVTGLEREPLKASADGAST